jgi:hypothetical protein
MVELMEQQLVVAREQLEVLLSIQATLQVDYDCRYTDLGECNR